MDSSLQTEALRIIRSTRSISFPHWGKAEILGYKSESASDVVTKLDIEIETYLANELTKLDADISFVGEETGGDRNAHRKWLVDPIDGTSHFIRGTPFCTTMVALIEDGIVTFSAIYDFINDTMYHAIRGGGSFQDTEPLHISTRPFNAAYIAYESNINTKEENIKLYLQLRKKVTLFNMAVSGYEFIQVASGKIEGRVCVDPYGKEYDFAPGSLLVSEAGGIVTNIGSTTYDYTNLNFIASNKAAYEALTQGEHALFPIT